MKACSNDACLTGYHIGRERKLCHSTKCKDLLLLAVSNVANVKFGSTL